MASWRHFVPPLSRWIVWVTPRSSSHKYCEGVPWNMFAKGSADRPPSTLLRLCNIARLEIVSYAFIPSTVGDAFASCLGGHGVLERRCGRLHRFHQLLRHRSGHQLPHHISHGPRLHVCQAPMRSYVCHQLRLFVCHQMRLLSPQRRSLRSLTFPRLRSHDF